MERGYILISPQYIRFLCILFYYILHYQIMFCTWEADLDASVAVRAANSFPNIFLHQEIQTMPIFFLLNIYRTKNVV
jgi:hypothetical protein